MYICSHWHVCMPVSTCTHSSTHCSSCKTPPACWWRCSTLVVVYEVQVSVAGGGMEWICTWDDNTSAVSLSPQPPSDLSDKPELCEYLLHIQGFCIPVTARQKTVQSWDQGDAQESSDTNFKPCVGTFSLYSNISCTYLRKHFFQWYWFKGFPQHVSVLFYLPSAQSVVADVFTWLCWRFLSFKREFFFPRVAKALAQ